MKSIFRATAILGSASIINILIGLVSSKVTAVLLGPSGFGLMALFQAIVGLAVMLAGLGVPAAFVRAAAGPIADGDMHREAVLRRAAWMISTCAALAAVLLLVLFRRWLEDVALGTRSGGTWIIFIAPGVFLSLMAAVQTGIVNARRRIGDLARINVFSAAISLVPTIILVWLFREGGVAPAVAANLLVIFLVGFVYYKKSAPDDPAHPGGWSSPEVSAAGRGLLRFGIPYMASLAAGTGVLTLLPILVLHALGPTEVGLFRAASAIAVNYLGVLVTAMAQDYFPRVARAPDDAAGLNRIVNEQLRLVLLIGGPVILAMLGAAPYLVPLLYSHKFAGAADLLEWQLIGDLFKFATWTMGFLIMVRMGGRTFFLTELVSGAVLLTSSWFGMRLWGLPGLGIGFLATGAFACLLNWAILRRSIGLKWTLRNAALFLSLAAAMALLRTLPSLGLEAFRAFAAAMLAAMFGAYSIVAIWRELGGWRGLRNWRQVE